jgi:hypothetical protein
LQRQLPAQLDRLPDHRGQKRGFGHQIFHLRRIGVAAENLLQGRVQPHHPTAQIAAVQLERQNSVVPRNLASKAHDQYPVYPAPKLPLAPDIGAKLRAGPRGVAA